MQCKDSGNEVLCTGVIKPVNACPMVEEVGTSIIECLQKWKVVDWSQNCLYIIITKLCELLIDRNSCSDFVGYFCNAILNKYIRPYMHMHIHNTHAHSLHTNIHEIIHKLCICMATNSVIAWQK